MVRADVIDGIDYILRSLRPEEYRKRCFGGIQMIFIGDAYQLPPIVKNNERMNETVDGVVKVGAGLCISEYLKKNHGGRYFFNPKVYRYTGFKYIELVHIFRQTDNTFIRILNGVRENNISETDLQLLNQREIVKCAYDPKEPRITVCARNKIADTINRCKMEELSTKMYTYHAVCTGVYADNDDTKPTGYKKDYPAEKDLELKEGAQIMMLKNDPGKKWVNGTMGIIKHLEDNYIEVKCKGKTSVVKKEEWQAIGYVYDRETEEVTSEIIGTFTQYPIRLAWAISIHKSQGKTFEKITVDLSGGGAFACGQTYVALSRCTSLEGILLTSEIKPADIMTDPEVINFVRDSSTHHIE